MTLPGYVAEGSLYRSGRSYRSHRRLAGATARPRVVLAQDETACRLLCQGRYFLCGLGCTATGPAGVLCAIGCFVDAVLCMEACNPPGGGGGGGGGGECGVGRRCCERDETGQCILCVPNNAQCP
jgi:hypothetical protein